MTPGRTRISSGGPWEERVGYSRAVRVDDRIWVSGTTGTHADGTVPDGAAEQARLALETIGSALVEAGASLDDVVAARVYVTDIEQWESVTDELPAHLVEIEVEAVVGSASA